MAVLLTLLFWFILLSHVNSQDNYDYSEIDVCSDNQDDPSLTCVRYTSCTQCRIYVENCNCDKLCHNYADCCPDVDALAATIYKPSSDTVICERRNLNGYTDRYLAVVSKCPVSSQDQCAAKGMSCSPHTTPSQAVIRVRVAEPSCLIGVGLVVYTNL